MPQRALKLHLAGVRSLLQLQSQVQIETISSIPKDPRSFQHMFNLNVVTEQFLVCVTCHALYPLTAQLPVASVPPLMNICTRKQTPSSPACETSLWDARPSLRGENSIRYHPRRTYVHQSLKYWLSQMMCRAGIEDIVDQRSTAYVPDNFSKDIWSSSIFSELRDVSGNAFLPGPPDEGRLIFSLSVDGFNPFYNKIAGISASSTGIWLVLLNLPPHLRFLPENVYLAGIIPGPDKPKTDALNNYIELVVNEFQDLWDPGLFLTRTRKHRLGRLFRAMLVPLVADMLAARQVLGLPGTTTAHNFCTYCNADYDDLHILDPREWPAKDLSIIRQLATCWRDADSEQDRRDIFDATGLRWSALLALPYWNPIKYAVIESMHALDLGLFEHHIRRLFRVEPDVDGGDGIATGQQQAVGLKPKRATSRDDLTSMNKCLQAIREHHQSLFYQLLSYPRKVLYTICVDWNILGPTNTVVIGTKIVLSKNICHWVSVHVMLNRIILITHHL